MHTTDRRVLLGNEAIARGLVEAGCQFITGYPGTPSSEVLPGVVQFKEELGLDLYAEWSTNEKVALETALAAAYSGKRTAVVMKQVGLNVAADPALSSAYIGVVGGLVMIVADDPGPHSSQTEQDTRMFSVFAKIPVLDPSTPREAKEMAAMAFDLSERHQIPVILRPTTRICHAKQTIECGPVHPVDRKAVFKKNPRRWAATPKARFQLHTLLNEKLSVIGQEFESWSTNELLLPDGDLRLGIVASGVSHAYLADLLGPMGLDGRVGLLKITTAYPLPQGLVESLRQRSDRLLVLEEPDAAVESQIRTDGIVWGRLTGHVPSQGELTPEVIEKIVVEAAREAGLVMAERGDRELKASVEAMSLPIRRPALCPGCGHRAAFYALRRAYPNAIFPGDIGCYTLGLNLGSVDTVHDMGASISMASGFYHAHAQDGDPPPIFATIGDGTFFHSGVSGLENAIYNGARFVLLILNNEVVGMTGMQPTPEFGATIDGHPGKAVSLEALVRGCGVEYLVEADAFDTESFMGTLREAHDYTRKPDGGVAVVLCRYACVTRMKGLGPDHPPIPVEVRHDPPPRAPDATAALDPPWLPRHEDKISPCAEACPAGNDIERLMVAAQEGHLADAGRELYAEHPFPSTLGRVCAHPCETGCNRSDYDGALAIRALERAAGDAARSAADWVEPAPGTGKSVAVVGGGPAGLTAAYHLARLGHEVEVFEARSEPGGMLRWAIPHYRLPTDVLVRELEVFDRLGVTIHVGHAIGREVSWSDLRRFDAVCLSTGAGRERRLEIPGEEMDGVVSGLGFLEGLRGGRTHEVGRRVAVIGGGNTAIDAARTARRLGAEVTVYYRRSADEMRAIPSEIEAARSEGIFFRYRVVPIGIKEGNNRALALQLRETRTEEAEVFSLGREGAEPTTEFWTEVDTVVTAVGATADLAPLRCDGLEAADRLDTDPWGRTSVPRVFGAGDASSRGTGTVAGAIDAGKRAALAIHAELSGVNLDERALRLVRGPGIVSELFHRPDGCSRAGRIQAAPPSRTIKVGHFARVPRAKPRAIPPDEAIWSFDEVERGLSPDQTTDEARERCFHCGVCTRCDRCMDACPYGAISRDGERYEIDLDRCTACRLCQAECPRSAITMPSAGTCVGCGVCTELFECPALVRGVDGRAEIDRKTCVDCGMCIQVCSQGAIRPRTDVEVAP